jgi:hypothetical protein
MHAIHAQKEQTDENSAEKLIAERMLNYAFDLKLNTTDTVRNEEVYELLHEQPELSVNAAQAASAAAAAAAAANLYDYVTPKEYIQLGKNTTSFADPELVRSAVFVVADVIANALIKCVTCPDGNCKWNCKLI